VADRERMGEKLRGKTKEGQKDFSLLGNCVKGYESEKKNKTNSQQNGLSTRKKGKNSVSASRAGWGVDLRTASFLGMGAKKIFRGEGHRHPEVDQLW